MCTLYQVRKITESPESNFRRMRFLMKTGVIVSFIILSILGCSESSGPFESSATLAPESQGVGTQNSNFSFDRSNWDILVGDPDEYKGAAVDIVGLVFTTPERVENMIAWQMYADPQEREGGMIVYIATSGFSIKSGEYVRVKGIVAGSVEGENLFGGKIRALAVLADSATLVDALAAAPTAVRVYRGSADSIVQHGVIISIDKVEFAETETRVFITIVNNSNDEANFYSFNAKAVQGNRQFEAEFGFAKDYPEVQSELLPGIQSSGIVVFPAMDPSTETQLHFEARTLDYLLDFRPYQFRIPAK